MDDLGKRLKKLRLDKGSSVSEVARVIGVSPSTYREWELGRKIKGEPYTRISEYFDISLNQLLTGKELKLDLFIDDMEFLIKRMRSCL